MTFEKEFNNWINGINKNEKPLNEIVAFWFGLIETEDGFTMYLIGSKEFDENDDDWACNNDFEPTNKYFDLPTNYTNGKSWNVILNDSLKILKDYANSSEFSTSIFRNAIAVACGFDDGDLNRIK